MVKNRRRLFFHVTDDIHASLARWMYAMTRAATLLHPLYRRRRDWWLAWKSSWVKWHHRSNVPHSYSDDFVVAIPRSSMMQTQWHDRLWRIEECTKRREGGEGGKECCRGRGEVNRRAREGENKRRQGEREKKFNLKRKSEQEWRRFSIISSIP